jgi:hypothetical protein
VHPDDAIYFTDPFYKRFWWMQACRSAAPTNALRIAR